MGDVIELDQRVSDLIKKVKANQKDPNLRLQLGRACEMVGRYTRAAGEYMFAEALLNQTRDFAPVEALDSLLLNHRKDIMKAMAESATRVVEHWRDYRGYRGIRQDYVK